MKSGSTSFHGLNLQQCHPELEWWEGCWDCEDVDTYTVKKMDESHKKESQWCLNDPLGQMTVQLTELIMVFDFKYQGSIIQTNGQVTKEVRTRVLALSTASEQRGWGKIYECSETCCDAWFWLKALWVGCGRDGDDEIFIGNDKEGQA